MKAASLCSRNLQAYKRIVPQIIFFNPGIKFSLAKCYYAKRVFNNLISVAFEKLILRNRVLFFAFNYWQPSGRSAQTRLCWI